MSSDSSCAASSAAALHEQRRRMRATAAASSASAEDDLLAQQEQFLHSRQSPAATITRATRSHNHQSLKAVSFASSIRTAADDDEEPAAPFPPVDQPVAQPRMVAAVLSDIVEHDASSNAVSSPSPQSIPLGSVHRGFPSTFKLRPSTSAAPHSAAPVKKSLFAQQREAMAARSQPQPSSPPPPPLGAAAEVRPRAEQGSGSCDLSAELGRIRAENERKIGAMTADEIREAQEELRAQLSPAMIAMLTKRGMAASASSGPVASPPQPSTAASIDRLFGQQDEEEDEEGAEGQEEKEAEEEERMEHAEEKEEQQATESSLPPSAYHSDPKTAWMEPLPYASSPPPWPTLTWDTGIASPSSPSSSSSSPSAPPPPPVVGTAWSYWRVDFKGKFLPASSSLASSSDRYDGLWHHGDQPQLAGYNMQELLLLSRSALPSQRVTALSTVACVLSCLHARAYTAPPLSALRADINDVVLEHLLALGLCSALRVAMDDTVVGVVTAAVRAVEALLARREEEHRRDALAAAHNGHLYPAPALSLGAVAAHDSPYIPPELDVSAFQAAGVYSESGNNEQDEQLCMRDVVAGLVRMQLLPRLRFLLHLHATASSPSSSAALGNSILHILLSVALHSSAAASAVHGTPHVLPLLSSMVYSDPISTASPTSPHLLPLLAVLSSSSGSAVHALSASSALLYSHHHLLVCNGLPGQIRPPVSLSALLLSCASLRLWRVALGYGKDAGSWLVFFPVIMQILVAWPATGREKKQGSDEEVEQGEMLQVRQCYNVLEGLCWCMDRPHGKDGKQDGVEEREEDRAISATHLANSVAHALSQLTSLLRAPMPHPSSPRLQSNYVSCLAGMAHFIASYYTARPSNSSTPSDVAQQWRDVLSMLLHSPAVQHCLAALSASPPSLSSSFFCFPSASLSSPALHETDLLVGLCRWLHTLLRADAAATALPALISQSPVLPFLLSLLSTLAALPTLDAHTALLGYYIVLIALEVAPFASPSLWYRPAVLVVPALLSCGYRQEALQLMRRAVLSSSALSAMRTERDATWTQRGADKLCPVCEWKAKDMMARAAMRAALLPMYVALMQAEDDGTVAISTHSLSVQSLALPPSSSALSLHGAATNATWLLLPLRSGLFLSSSSSRPLSDRIALARTYLQYLSLLVSSSLFLPSPSLDLTVTIRAVMDVFTLGPACYTDPSLTPVLTHLAHVLLSPGAAGLTFSTAALNAARGWGWNFFSFFQSLVERYVGEGLGESTFASFVLLLMRRRHPVDYRLLLLSSLAHCDVVEDDGVVVAWEECLWPREDSAELLRAYKDWIIRQAAVRAGGADESLGVVSVVAMHHLLCDWLSEDVVRTGWRDSEEEDVREKVRAKLGGAAADDGVVHALCRYRYTARQ